MTIEESVYRELMFIGESCTENCLKSTKTVCKLHRPIGIVLPNGKNIYCLAKFSNQYCKSLDSTPIKYTRR